MPRRSSYAHIKGGVKPDLRPEDRFHSNDEADLARVFEWMKRRNWILDYAYWDQEDPIEFAGMGTKGNYKMRPDFKVYTLRRGRIQEWFVEYKGRLPQGGRLTRDGRTCRIDLTELDRHGDSDSRIKAERLMRHYRKTARRTYYVGMREWRIIRRLLKNHIDWETGYKPKKTTTQAA